MNQSVFQQTGFDTQAPASRGYVARRAFVQDLTTQSRRSADFYLLVGSRAFCVKQPSLLDQSTRALRSDLQVYRYLSQSADHVRHHLPLVDAVRQLVEDERINAARALLAREAPATLRTGDLATWNKVLAEPRAVPGSDHGCDRTADYDWLSKHARNYRGEWVAIEDGELVAHAKTLRELLRAVRDPQRIGKPLVHKIR